MLPAAHRLHRPADFSAVVRRGRRSGRRHLVVHLLPAGAGAPEGEPTVAPETSPGPARVGFVVSRAVGGSVVRNRVERRLRHLVREHLDALPAGVRVVVRANPPASGATHEQLRSDLVAAMASAARPRARA